MCSTTCSRCPCQNSVSRCIHFPAMTASVCNLRPESRQVMSTSPPNKSDHPEIQPNYLSAEADKRVAADAIRLTGGSWPHPPCSGSNPKNSLPGPDLTDEEDLVKAAGEIGTTIFHPVSTCRMGTDESVRGRWPPQTHGDLKTFASIDASVMPTITSGNTNAPTVMIAEKGADMIREDRRAPT